MPRYRDEERNPYDVHWDCVDALRDQLQLWTEEELYRDEEAPFAIEEEYECYVCNKRLTDDTYFGR